MLENWKGFYVGDLWGGTELTMEAVLGAGRGLEVRFLVGLIFDAFLNGLPARIHTGLLFVPEFRKDPLLAWIIHEARVISNTDVRGFNAERVFRVPAWEGPMLFLCCVCAADFAGSPSLAALVPGISTFGFKIGALVLDQNVVLLS